MNTAGTFSLSYCGSNVVHQFFCDIPQLLAISCSGKFMNKLVPILITVVLIIFCFIFIIISYVHIFSAVRKIPSTEVVPPNFNPVIYSLRNQTLKTAVGRLMEGQYSKMLKPSLLLSAST
ncbi:olfactory receptor 14A16-like [Talpa occidentalis]|uniref:olfactory receptor 14A16-like n=1 Tax=Talpa occidentalis TaxID=50954 RepID=UPI0023FA0046|nr:olfactory receptor 14A16-like [Talpa occidentalis]